jgi:hypothetical protein
MISPVSRGEEGAFLLEKRNPPEAFTSKKGVFLSPSLSTLSLDKQERTFITGIHR